MFLSLTITVRRLDLNLRNGRRKEDNIVLNLSVRFHEQVICRNSRIDGVWGDEERTENLYERKEDNLNPIVSGTKPNMLISHVNISINTINYLFLAYRRNIQILHFNWRSKVSPRNQ